MTPERRRNALSALCFAVVATLLLPWIAGCGGSTSGPVCHPVQGTIFHEGKPLAEAMVFFHPREPAESAQIPVGVTDQEGHFELTTIRPGDGAPAGLYQITVELRDLQPNSDGEMERTGRNLLPRKYQDSSTSDLEFIVNDGENEVPRIELK